MTKTKNDDKYYYTEYDNDRYKHMGDTVNHSYTEHGHLQNTFYTLGGLEGATSWFMFTSTLDLSTDITGKKKQCPPTL